MRELPLFKKKLMLIDLRSLPTREKILNYSEETMVSLKAIAKNIVPTF